MDHFESELETNAFRNEFQQLISYILTTYITGIYTICVVSGKIGGTVESVKAFSIIPYVSIQLDVHDEKFNSSNNPLLVGIESGCSVFIVHQRAALDFLDVFVELHDEAGYRNPNKYVLLPMDAAQSRGFLDSVREHPSLSEVLNFIIFQPVIEMTAVDLLTNRFVGSVENYASEFYLLDRYHFGKGSFEYGNWLFPDKTIDLYGRSIRVASFNVKPHVFIREVEGRTPMIRSNSRAFSMDGLDGVLLVEFCRRRNCTIELVVDEINMWGMIQANRTGNGLLGNLVERRADLGLGALSSWYHCYQYLAFSTPIQRGTVTCLTPKPNILPRWKIITMAFATSVYLTIFGMFCGVISVYLLISYMMMDNTQQRSIIWNALNVLAIFLLQATNVRNRSVSESILSLALLMFSLNMGSIYSGKYASLRTIHLYEPTIDTIVDLSESGIPWLQAHEAWSFSLLLSENPTIVKLVSNFKVYPPSELLRIADQGGSAFALGRLHNGHLMLGDWITADNIHRYRLMKGELYYEYEVAMGTKTWPLMERFNEMILQTASGLLMRAQELRIIYQYDDYYVQRVALNSREQEANEPKPLGLEDVQGGLIVLLFGLLCAGVVFMLEVMHVRNSKRDKSAKLGKLTSLTNGGYFVA